MRHTILGKKFKLTAAALCVGLLTASCAGSDTPDDSGDDLEETEAEAGDEESEDSPDADDGAAEDVEVVTLRIGHTNDPGHPMEVCGAIPLGDRLEEKTGGTLTLNSFPAGQLGTNNEMGEQLVSGSLDMGLAPVPVLAQYHPPAGVLNSIFLFESADEAEAAINGEFGRGLHAGILEDGNVRVLGSWYYGARHLTTSGEPARNPEDLAGRDIRAIDNEVQIANVSALGADPSPIAFGELYLALQQGIVDGQENPIATIAAQGFEEVQDYIMLTGHLFPWLAVSISEITWQELSPEHQTALQEAVDETSSEVRACIEEAEQAQLEAWRESGALEVIEDVDDDAFRERAASVLSEIFPNYLEIQETDWLEQ